MTFSHYVYFMKLDACALPPQVLKQHAPCYYAGPLLLQLLTGGSSPTATVTFLNQHDYVGSTQSHH